MRNTLTQLAVAAGLLLGATGASAIELKRPDLTERNQRGDFKLPIVSLGSDIEVYELSASGQTTLKQDDTEAARAATVAALDAYFAKGQDPKLVKPTELTAEQQAELKEYFALYDVVAAASLTVLAHGWEHRKEHFDYTLGNGLPWLKAKTGARYAIVTNGVDYVSSGGRVALMLVAAAAGVAIPMGRSFTVVGVIDLDNGDLVWLDHDSGVGDLKNLETVKGRYSSQIDHLLHSAASGS
jgi:hypothetical protein